jgi:hypothetical protein
MNLSQDQWNAEMSLVNYDQAWSMVHFLAHGENGKYQKAFGAFVGDLGKGLTWQVAWDNTFGGTEGFEKQWRAYWLNLPENPTIDLYTKANVSIFISFIARANSQGQTFANFDAFKDAASKQQLKCSPQDTLPDTLLKDALEQLQTFTKLKYTYTLAVRPGEKIPQLLCTSPSGAKIIGRFVTQRGKPPSVTTELIGKK